MDAKLHGAHAAQDLSTDSVPKTPAEQHEENLVGFYYKQILCFRKRIMWSLIILFLYGNTGFVWFSLIYC